MALSLHMSVKLKWVEIQGVWYSVWLDLCPFKSGNNCSSYFCQSCVCHLKHPFNASFLTYFLYFRYFENICFQNMLGKCTSVIYFLNCCFSVILLWFFFEYLVFLFLCLSLKFDCFCTFLLFMLAFSKCCYFHCLNTCQRRSWIYLWTISISFLWLSFYCFIPICVSVRFLPILSVLCWNSASLFVPVLASVYLWIQTQLYYRCICKLAHVCLSSRIFRIWTQFTFLEGALWLNYKYPSSYCSQYLAGSWGGFLFFFFFSLGPIFPFLSCFPLLWKFLLST